MPCASSIALRSLALEVFYKSESHRLVVAELFYNNGDFSQTRHARCAPAAFAGDELIAAVWHRAHEKRLNDAVFRYAVRKLGERILVKYFFGWSRLGSISIILSLTALVEAISSMELSANRASSPRPSPPFCCHLYFPFRLSCFSFRSFSGTRPQSRYMRSFPLSFCHSTLPADRSSEPRRV